MSLCVQHAHREGNQMNINLRSMRIFCEVVERRSFSRAADENGISQSSASQAVHQLEDRLGVQLLDRSKRPFLLTAEGERYYEGCRQIVKQHQQLADEIHSLHDETARSLTVASIYSVGLAHMTAFMRRFTSQYPSAQVNLDYFHPAKVYEAVEEGVVDLGLVSYPEEARKLTTIAWRTERLVLACPPEHLLASRESIALSELAGEAFVTFAPDLRIRAEIDRALLVNRVDVNVTHEFDNVEMIKRDIEGGSGVGILPEPTLENEIASGTLAKVPLADKTMMRPLGIIHRSDCVLNQVAKRFINLLCADDEFAKYEETEEVAATSNGRHTDQLSH